MTRERPEASPRRPPSTTADPARLAALAGYGILDTPPEPDFDDIAQLAAAACDAPVALVSLVAGDRQWFKARLGFEPLETDLNSSVCAYALDGHDLLVIPDLTADPRTAANPLVTGEPRIRFYAGAPLRTEDGHVLGSLCVIDGAPRPEGVTERQAEMLRSLARQVVRLLDLRRAVAERDTLLKAQDRADARRSALLKLGDQLRELGTVPEMVREAAAIVAEVLGVSRAGFGRIEPDGGHVVVEADWTAEGQASVVGRHRSADNGELGAGLLRGESVVIRDVLADPRTSADPGRLLALGIRALVNVPVLERGRPVAVFFVHASEPREWAPETQAFLRNVADRLEAGVARLRAEYDQRMLNEELGHRMKNMLAMVQAIAGQTLKGVGDQDAVVAFRQRLHALSSAQDVLLQRSWSAAGIGEVVAAALGAVGQTERFDVSGPALNLGPRAALSLALLLHELATNALKHGSLSAEAGRVAVSWRVEGRAEEQGGAVLLLDWSEAGGPPAAEPTRRGFGTRLIRTGLVGTGGVVLRYLPSGFQAEMRAPLDQAQAA